MQTPRALIGNGLLEVCEDFGTIGIAGERGSRLGKVLFEARVGFEAMDTRAACRTYNILMSEGRRVLAAMLPL